MEGLSRIISAAISGGLLEGFKVGMPIFLIFCLSMIR